MAFIFLPVAAAVAAAGCGVRGEVPLEVWGGGGSTWGEGAIKRTSGGLSLNSIVLFDLPALLTQTTLTRYLTLGSLLIVFIWLCEMSDMN